MLNLSAITFCYEKSEEMLSKSVPSRLFVGRCVLVVEKSAQVPEEYEENVDKILKKKTARFSLLPDLMRKCEGNLE